MLNRAVLIVRPKQPYIDWAAGLDDSGLVPDPEGEQTVGGMPDEGESRHSRARPDLRVTSVIDGPR